MYSSFFAVKGLRFVTAGDGETALQVARDVKPDVIVMDLSLPRVDGWEATRRLKRDARTAQIPIIACTGHAFGAAVERALEAGCDAYVVKPCPPEDLLFEVERALERSNKTRQA
jgi:two-component system cell cycle response regulator DivK